jgi:peptidoglycan/LPS O-acetylase OafA/YrhL
VPRIRQLDSVRGLAVLLVFLHNSNNYPSLRLGVVASDGWMAVDLFFVLSGFLITGSLVDTRHSKGYYTAFYTRRCLRIWPLYYSALLIMLVLIPLVQPSQHYAIFGPRSSPWWSYVIFLQNFFVPVPTMAAGLLGVTWSLAIEEQFYLVWPVVVRYLNDAQLRSAGLAVIIMSPLLRYYLSLHHVNIYSNTFCRLDGLMAGSLLALAIRSSRFDPSELVAVAWMALCVSAPMAILLERVHARWICCSFVVLASLSFVYLVLFSKQAWLQAILKSRVLIYTGTISYGMYLLGKLPCDAVKLLALDRHPLVALLASLVATYVVASLSWKLLEKPALSLRDVFAIASRRRAVSAEGIEAA